MTHAQYIQLLAGSLGFLAVVIAGAGYAALGGSRRRVIEERLGGPVGAAAVPVSEQGQPKYYKALYGLGAAVAPKGTSKGLTEELAQAGIYGRTAPLVFMGIKIVCFAGALLGAMLLIGPVLHFLLPDAEVSMTLQVLWVLIVAMLGLMAPNIVLSIRRGRRQTEVRNHLPDAVDLLEICVSAGMGLDAAWRSVTDQIRRVSPVLADEMSLTDLEINLGGTRAMAMRHMAERTRADELNWLVTSFIQAERFGVSISETLRAFAASIRENRTQKAEESAEKMAVRILFPLIIFIFPTILIVTAGPAAIKIAEVFGSR